MKWISDCLSELHKGVQTISAESNLAETSSPEGNEIVGFHRRLKDFHTEKTVQVSQLRVISFFPSYRKKKLPKQCYPHFAVSNKIKYLPFANYTFDSKIQGPTWLNFLWK